VDRHSFPKLIVDRLKAERERIADQWHHPEGTHTRHFHVDDLLPAYIARAIYQAFPRNAGGFFERASFREKKKTLTDLSKCLPILSAVIYALQAQKIIDAITDITGFRKLLPDPSLYAAGLSMMFKDDFLNPHIDNSHDRSRTLYRRLNLLYYVSPDWKIDNGGNFEMWDTSVSKHKTVLAKFNRLLVMETNKISWHSVSKVTVDEPRCCVSTYVFSPDSPNGDDYFHVTSFLGRPGETARRVIGRLDNALRQTASIVLKTGRGRSMVNKTLGSD
jgi:Rps23 Pro-64 3,4-dihydroxylase Tpa1-like proline 4-hydroxylase